MKQEMDLKLEKMQFLGIFGILQEVYKIIYTWRKTFSQITLFLIFPLSLFLLAYSHISNHMIQNFLLQIFLTKSQKGHNSRFIKLSDLVVSYKLAYFLLFIVIYNVFLSIISIPSTSAITYAVAGIYTGGEVTFKKSLKVVAKVWKRVLITSFYSLAFSFTYDSVAACVLLLIFRGIIFRYRFDPHVNASIVIVFMVMYFVGVLYLNTIWMLSRVVSVLDEPYGFKALMKSQRLLRGKMVAATILLFLTSLFGGMILFLYDKVVVRGVVLGMMGKSFLGIVCLVLLVHFFLLKVVVLTVLYFVCKSYHCENVIDTLDLSSLVEVYVSLKANDVQAEIEKLLV